MQVFAKPPQLIINSADQFIICQNAYEAYNWLTPKVLDKSDGFVLYDPTGYLHRRYSRLFKRSGYAVKTYDTGDLSGCSRYNPFAYVRNNRDIPKLAVAFIGGTECYGYPDEINFRSAEIALLTSLFSCVANEASEEERNIYTVIEMLKYMSDTGIKHYDSDYERKHAIDFVFEEFAETDPHCFYLQQYEFFKEIAGHYENDVVDSCIWRLKPFDTDIAKDSFAKDELEFDLLGSDQKTAIFVSPGISGEFSFLIPLLYTQLLDTLCNKSV